jgi:hypothetical protein
MAKAVAIMSKTQKRVSVAPAGLFVGDLSPTAAAVGYGCIARFASYQPRSGDETVAQGVSHGVRIRLYRSLRELSAAQRRRNVAHGVSHGVRIRLDRPLRELFQPRSGDRNVAHGVSQG